MSRLLLTVIAAFLLACMSTLPAGETAENRPMFRFEGGEHIQIQIYGENVAEFNWQAQPAFQMVTLDGCISVPAAGIINVKGMTLAEATEAVVGKVRTVHKLKTPQISIALQSMRPRWVYVQGEVARPQQIEISHDRPLYLAAVLAAAGGTTADADLTRVQVLHGEATGRDAAEEIVDMSAAKTGKIARGPALQSGDIVYVPSAESFSVLGEVNGSVNHRGTYGRADSRVKSGRPIRLSDAIAAAGGLKPSADLLAVKLLRPGADGTEPRLETYDLQAGLYGGNTAQDPILQDGDKILVGANDGFLLLGRVRSPGVFYAPGVGGAPLTVSRLIALGGGFDTYARKSAVMLIRKDKPGEPLLIDVKSIVEGGKLDKDLPLNPGDIVFVGESSL